MKIEVIKSATTKWEDQPVTDQGVIVITMNPRVVTWDLPRDASPIETALELHNAKRILGTESFYDMIKSGVTGCTPSRVDNLLRIASNPVLGNPQHRASIPVTESALACLADVAAGFLEAGLRIGTVHPSMTEQAARDFASTYSATLDSRCLQICPIAVDNERACDLEEVVRKHLSTWPYGQMFRASVVLHALAEQVGAEEGALNHDPARNL